MRGVSWLCAAVVWAALGCESNDGAAGMTADAAASAADVAPDPSDGAEDAPDILAAVDVASVDDAAILPGDVATVESDLGPGEDSGADAADEPDAADAPDAADEPDSDDEPDADDEPDTADGPDAPSPDVTACTPACDGLSCGPDGCGGECGACGDGEVCTLGLCSTPGACTNESDGGVLASLDVAAKVEGCAKGCVLDSDKAACGGNCLAKETGLSAGCAACFGGNVACAFTKCTFECGFGTAEKCLECQTTAGCFVEFEACAGLMPP